MDPLKIDPEYLHRMSKFYPQLLKHIEAEGPDLSGDDAGYRCQSGRDETDRIVGYGPTLQDALEEWEKAYQKNRP